MNINDKTLQALNAAVRFREMRHELITSNLANSETPGYKAKVLDFEESLARALDVDGEQSLSTSDPRHFKVGGGSIGQVAPEIYDNPNGDTSPDGNTVDPESEIVNLNENKIMYDAAIQLMGKKMGLTKYILGSEK